MDCKSGTCGSNFPLLLQGGIRTAGQGKPQTLQHPQEKLEVNYPIYINT